MTRILLFLATNAAILVVISLVFNLLGIDGVLHIVVTLPRDTEDVVDEGGDTQLVADLQGAVILLGEGGIEA